MPPEMMERDIVSRLARWTGQSVGIEHRAAKAMQGVIAPAVYGGKLRRILCYLDRQKLEVRGLSLMDVQETLLKQNVLIPAGNAKGEISTFRSLPTGGGFHLLEAMIPRTQAVRISFSGPRQLLHAADAARIIA